MNSPWPVFDDCTPLKDLAAQRVEHILAAFDGPAILSLMTPDGTRLIAVAVDEVDKFIRWVQCSIGTPEWKALMGGRMGLYDAFTLESSVEVVDRTPDGKAVRGWEIPLASLRSEHLPNPGALLPTEVLRKFGASAEQKPLGPLRLSDIPLELLSQVFPRRAAS
jgi:hypothetical protein